jgi:small subunit ribosomal protein S21
LGIAKQGFEPRSKSWPLTATQTNDFKITKIKKNKIMIIMPVKEGENIEKALKKFKRKYERTGVLKELRRRQYFTKPSIAKREQMQHAIYVEHTYRQEE